MKELNDRTIFFTFPGQCSQPEAALAAHGEHILLVYGGMGLFYRQMIDLYPARLDQFRSGAAADVQHGREYRVQPQGGHGGGEQLPLRCREGRDLFRLQQAVDTSVRPA